jgi:hypothetical protein
LRKIPLTTPRPVPNRRNVNGTLRKRTPKTLVVGVKSS